MPRKLRFGVMYDFRNPIQWHRPWADFYREMIDFVAWTETIGFDDAWLTEHHQAEDGYLPSPLIVAAAIAQRTKTLKIGTAIAVGPLYHPVRFAEDAAVLDIISGGRAEFGVGLGYRRVEFEGYGVPFEGRGGRTSELLQIVRRLWNGETVTFHGKYFQLDRAMITPRPVQAHPPLWIGGFNREAFRRAARYGDGIIGGGDMSRRWAEYIEELQACGKGPGAARALCGLLWFQVSNDPEKTWNEVAPHVLHQVSTYAAWLKDTSHQVFSALSLDELKASGTLQVVTPDQAIQTIRKLTSAVPLEGIYGMVPPAGYPLDRLAEHFELFAQKVIPAFR